MIKIPSYQCEFMHHTTTCVKFVGKHVIPLLRQKVRRMGVKEPLTVKRPDPGLDPDMYWIKFPDTDSEYGRITAPDGEFGSLGAAEYPTVQDLVAVIDTELEKLAANHGINPNLPSKVSAPPALVALVTKAYEGKFDKDESADAVAIALASIGITSVGDVASAGLSKLCSAKFVGDVAAAKLRDTAREQEAANEVQDALKGAIPGMGIFGTKPLPSDEE